MRTLTRLTLGTELSWEYRPGSALSPWAIWARRPRTRRTWSRRRQRQGVDLLGRHHVTVLVDEGQYLWWTTRPT